MKIVTNTLKQIKYHYFNQEDYSTEIYLKTRQDLIKKVSKEEKIMEFFKFLVHLTAFDYMFIQCGSNSLYLLVEMKVDLKNHCFENIQIKNTSLIGANFVRCNFSGSQFDNVDISGMNLNEAQLFNCKWKNLKIHELSKLDGHCSCVNSVCFSPDSTTLASGCLENSIHIWDVKTGQQKFQLDGHTCFVRSVCFSPNGTTLVSGSNDKSIRLWDVKTGQQKSKLDGHTNYVMSVCFSPDGNTLASGSIDNSIRLWDVKTEQLRSKMDCQCNGVLSVCFSPDGITLASDCRDKSIRLWNVKTRKKIPKLNGHTHYVYSVCFSPDSTTVASVSDDNSIRIWDFNTGKEIRSLDKSYKDTLASFKTPLFSSNPHQERISTNITIHLISQSAIFQAQGALILKGEFVNQSGVDLRTLFKQKGSFVLDSQLELKQK